VLAYAVNPDRDAVGPGRHAAVLIEEEGGDQFASAISPVGKVFDLASVLEGEEVRETGGGGKFGEISGKFSIRVRQLGGIARVDFAGQEGKGREQGKDKEGGSHR
jgi:hypothetical protein|tara:strand:+ start:78762 stop:79076 length:315 start_codon:yes stop_codon:yes gene_type:complete